MFAPLTKLKKLDADHTDRMDKALKKVTIRVIRQIRVQLKKYKGGEDS